MACAAEIFRFLRDMALETTSNLSPSLLHGSSFIGSKALRQRDKNFYGSPPITSRGKGSGGGGGAGVFKNLIHPGAILCMIDLLPSVAVPEDIWMSAEKVGSVIRTTEDVLTANGRESSPLSLDTDSSSSFEVVSPRTRISVGHELITPTDHTHMGNPPADHTHNQAPLHPHNKSSSPESDTFFDAELEQEVKSNEGVGLIGEGVGLGRKELKEDVFVEVGREEGMGGGEVKSGKMDKELAWKVSYLCW